MDYVIQLNVGKMFFALAVFIFSLDIINSTKLFQKWYIFLPFRKCDGKEGHIFESHRLEIRGKKTPFFCVSRRFGFRGVSVKMILFYTLLYRILKYPEGKELSIPLRIVSVLFFPFNHYKHWLMKSETGWDPSTNHYKIGNYYLSGKYLLSLFSCRTHVQIVKLIIDPRDKHLKALDVDRIPIKEMTEGQKKPVQNSTGGSL
jgi:hypothetical protein